MKEAFHKQLPGGIEFAGLEIPHRRAVALSLRFLTGVADEPEDLLGIARLTEQTINKGTEKHDGRALADAFDEIGVQRGSAVGQESTSFACTCLPEYVQPAIDLHREFLCTPTFPEDACQVAIELANQELNTLEDDPHAFADKLLGRQAYGPVLGRHALGETETLARIDRDAIERHWRGNYSAACLQVTMAGNMDPTRAADLVERTFDGFGSSRNTGRGTHPMTFSPARTHHHKELEQQQIGICFPGVARTDPAYYPERVLLGILAGGMSGRLFTEIREKHGLVYWVSAWHEHPRGAGMIHLGASTTPERCDKTYESLLREVDRLAEDLTQDELDRAITGIVSKVKTRGDITRAHCSELAGDLFYFHRLIPLEEKLAKVRAVTIEDIKQYLQTHPRNQLSVVTLGPKQLVGWALPTKSL